MSKAQMSKEERLNRILARGETHGHSHVITGNCTIERTELGVFINTEDSNVVMKHLLESDWLEGKEVFTQEHEDKTLNTPLVRHGDVTLKQVSEGRYQYLDQIEYDPFDEIIRQVRD